ncbi:heme ABC transporter permease [Burkholderia sp. MSMB1552]|uniref:FecCD family ABC transporter permease n=1 Tax=Burkholderia sp. MSMB1552 TaxID=1636424 RepID=UPI0007569C23|nr:heme ABC transporter permease [Burkholderia sp. MSMB1552]KWZ49439.1 heme ABC transporter permease [Burkholderia sp. MSMB1588]
MKFNALLNSLYASTVRNISRSQSAVFTGRLALATLALGLIAVMVTALCIGPYRLPLERVLAAMFASDASLLHDPELRQMRYVLLEIRAPRVIMAILVGGGLGLSGSAMQALFRNPLADPGLLGISSSAAFGAAAMIVLGSLFLPHPVVFGYLPVAAFACAFAASLLMYSFAASSGRLAIPLLLLAGIAVNALAIGGIGLLIYVSNGEQLRTLTFWNLGSVAGANWTIIAAVAPIIALGGGLLLGHRRALNALQLGETEAQHLGVPVLRVKRVVLFGVALCVGTLVACTGVIGFVGLVAPHCMRLLGGPDQRFVMPAAALFGAILMLLADLGARTLHAPAEIPLGILTALFGAPFFLALLLKKKAVWGM